MRADYAGNITLIDDQIGEILKTVETRGELDNTVIVFSSDHGEMNGDFGLIYKETFLNPAVRVPLLVRPPQSMEGAARGTVLSAPAEWFDIGPTIAELTGTNLPYQQFAESLCPLLTSREEKIRDYAVSELRGEIMIMDSRWKLAVNNRGIPYLLFNLEADPDEQTNLVTDPDHQETVKRLRLLLQEHLVRNQVRLCRD
jgi:choline-sulfatase